MKHISYVTAAVIGLTLLAPGVTLADSAARSSDISPISRVMASGLSEQPLSGQFPDDDRRRLQSWYSLKYYLSADAGMKDGYPEGRSMVVERKGNRIFVTIVTMQGTPSCFVGTKSGSTFYGKADNGYPPYGNWTLSLRNTRRGVIVTFDHAGSSPYPEKYRNSSKAGIRRMFGWNALEDHQNYQRQCSYN